MASQRSERRRLRIDFERNMVGLEPARGQRDQRAKRMRTDEVVQHIDTRFCEMAGQIHAFLVSAVTLMEVSRNPLRGM